MPLKLNVGVSRKLGLPEYSSVGASCQIEVELDSSLLQFDLDGFHAEVRGVFIAAQQAVNDQLVRSQMQLVPPAGAPANAAPAPVPPTVPAARSNGTPPRPLDAPARPPKPATPSQLKAIYAITRARKLDLERLLHDTFGIARLEELSLAEASQLIDELRAAGAG